MVVVCVHCADIWSMRALYSTPNEYEVRIFGYVCELLANRPKSR